jgi:hypothetical protein
VVFSAAATAGLIGGVGAAVGAVPANQPAPQASGPSAGSLGGQAEETETAWLKANLARTSGDGASLRARIAQLESDTARAKKVRAKKLRAQKARAQQVRALELRQKAQELGQQRAILAEEQSGTAGQASYVPSKPAPRLARYAPVRRSASKKANRSSAPKTHARTGASGATTNSGQDREDSDHESRESDHDGGESDD